jgi:hypothetical protein
MKRPLSILALLALWGPLPASGQSLMNAAGLGLPISPGDARARALGGVALGLRGATILGTDPSAAAGLALPTVVMTAQPSWVDFGRSDTGESGRFRGTRFPSLGIAYPAWSLGMVTLTFESYLDQRFEAERPVTLQLLDEEAPATDEFVSRGGVSQVRLGFARTVGQSARVGVAVGRYTGTSTRRLVRSVNDTLAFESFESFQDGGRWSYSGASLTAGASVTVGEFAEVAGSATWSSGLEATASEDTRGSDRTWDVPLELRIGASAVLAPGLSLAAGITRADWSGVDDDLADGASLGSTYALGVGVELTRATFLGRSAPLRFGYSRRDLPFTLADATPRETAWTGGLGLALDQVGELVRAAVDLAVERGTREDGPVAEDFWRASLTLRLSGL